VVVNDRWQLKGVSNNTPNVKINRKISGNLTPGFEDQDQYFRYLAIGGRASKLTFEFFK